MRRSVSALLLVVCFLLSAGTCQAAMSLRVGVYQNPPLLFFDESGQGRGLFADVLAEVAKGADWELRWMGGNWDDLVADLEAGSIDLLPCVAYTEARAGRMAFISETVLANWGQIFAPQGAEYSSLLDLAGRRIAMLKGDVHNAALRGLLDRFQVPFVPVEYGDFNAVLRAVESGEADAGAVNRVFGVLHGGEFRVQATPIVFNPIEIRFAVPKADPRGLVPVLDREIAALKAEPASAYYAAMDRWLGGKAGWTAPDWLWPGATALGGLLVLVTAFCLILRRQVARSAAEAVRAEGRYREMVQGAPVGVFQATLDGGYLSVNPALARMFRYDSAEAMLAGVTDIAREVYFDPEDRRAFIDSVRREGSAAGYSVRLRRRDGEPFWVFMHARLVTDPAVGEYLEGFVVDDSERRAAEDRLRRELRIKEAAAAVLRAVLDAQASLRDMAEVALEHALALTGSADGFVSLVDPADPGRASHTLAAARQGADCPLGADSAPFFSPDPEGVWPGLWGHCFNLRRGFFTNDAAGHPAWRGLPADHPPIGSFLAAPALVGDRMLGQIALANAARPYDERDLESVASLAGFFALAVARRQDEEALRELSRTRGLLLQEIHHRVKNNLQIVVSLLRLQSEKVREEEAREAFRESMVRIGSMALVHEELYRGGDLAGVDFQDYLRRLADNLFRACAAGRDIRKRVEVDPIRLPIETAIPCGLLVNELVSNALKHAFAGRAGGEVRIELRRDGEDAVLTVADDGIGLSPDWDLRAQQTLGLQLVRNLAEQLEGSLSVETGEGTVFAVRFRI